MWWVEEYRVIRKSERISVVKLEIDEKVMENEWEEKQTNNKSPDNNKEKNVTEEAWTRDNRF